MYSVTSPIKLPEKRENTVPTIKSVHPCGHKVLVECLRNDEIYSTNIEVVDSANVSDVNQAYVIAVGPTVPKEWGLQPGQRIYWTGKGLPVDDPRANYGRKRVLLDVSNVVAIIEE